MKMQQTQEHTFLGLCYSVSKRLVEILPMSAQYASNASHLQEPHFQLSHPLIFGLLVSIACILRSASPLSAKSSRKTTFAAQFLCSVSIGESIKDRFYPGRCHNLLHRIFQQITQSQVSLMIQTARNNCAVT